VQWYRGYGTARGQYRYIALSCPPMMLSFPRLVVMFVQQRGAWCGCAAVCFESVTVSGAEAVQADLMGVYSKLANVTQGDRPVYQLVGYTVAYLFHWPSTSGWRIGSNYTSDLAGVKNTGNAGVACPDQATGWQAYTGSAWVGTYPITVVQSAPTLSPATVTGGAGHAHSPGRTCRFCAVYVMLFILLHGSVTSGYGTALVRTHARLL
jgi:hypothetical protein